MRETPQYIVFGDCASDAVVLRGGQCWHSAASRVTVAVFPINLALQVLKLKGDE